MHFLSDSYRLREAILAERAEERAKTASRTEAPVAAATKTEASSPRAGVAFLASLKGRLPRITLDGKVK